MYERVRLLLFEAGGKKIYLHTAVKPSCLPQTFEVFVMFGIWWIGNGEEEFPEQLHDSMPGVAHLVRVFMQIRPLWAVSVPGRGNVLS